MLCPTWGVRRPKTTEDLWDFYANFESMLKNRGVNDPYLYGNTALFSRPCHFRIVMAPTHAAGHTQLRWQWLLMLMDACAPIL